MLIHPWDAARDPDEWRHFAVAQGFGQLIAAGAGRRRPIVVPTQFVLDDDTAPTEPASAAADTVPTGPARGPGSIVANQPANGPNHAIPSGAADTVPSEPASRADNTVPSEPASAADNTMPNEPASAAGETVPNEFPGPAFGTVLLHLARPNPIWPALVENPYAVLALAGDWAYIPSSWKTTGDEDPALGIPTTYYGAVQLSGEVEIIDEPEGKLAILRKQLAALQRDGGHADPAAHRRQLSGIRGIRLKIDDVQAKFKYGGNVDATHRLAVADHLSRRNGPGDAAARDHLMRQLKKEGPCP